MLGALGSYDLRTSARTANIATVSGVAHIKASIALLPNDHLQTGEAIYLVTSRPPTYAHPLSSHNPSVLEIFPLRGGGQ